MTGDPIAAALAAFGDADTAETRQRILYALAQGELLFPTAERGAGDADFRLAFTKDHQGRQVLPAFTDERHLSRWLPGGGSYATAVAADFLPMALAGPFAGLVLNPGSDASAFVDRRALELLAAGETTHETDRKGEALVQEWTPNPG